MSEFQKILDGINDGPVTVFVTPRGIGFNWAYKGTGIGEIFISLAEGATPRADGLLPEGRLRVDSECMSKEFVKKVICQAIDESEFL